MTDPAYKHCPECGADCHLKDMEKGGSCYGIVGPDNPENKCISDDGQEAYNCNHSCENEGHRC